jgi:hypothetical protein
MFIFFILSGILEQSDKRRRQRTRRKLGEAAFDVISRKCNILANR